MMMFSFSSSSPSNNKMDPQQSISSSDVLCCGQSGSSTVDVRPMSAKNTPVAIVPASPIVMRVYGEFLVTLITRRHKKMSHGFFRLV